MTDLEKASAVVADLEARRAAVVAQQDKAAEDRRGVAFAAIVDGKEAAMRQLGKINDFAIKAATELASLDAALVEARRRVAEAEAAEALAAEKEKMRGVATVTTALRAHAVKLDELLIALVAEYEALISGVVELQQAGFSQPSLALMAVNAPRAVQSALIGTNLESERIPPLQRHTFAELVSAWVAHADARAKTVLGDAG